MASVFDAVFGRCAQPAHFSFNGEEMTYTPRDETEGEDIVAAVRWREGIGEFTRTDGRKLRIEAEIDVDIQRDCPNLQRGDVFTIDGADYRVDRMPSRTSTMATVVALLIEAVDAGRQGRILPTGG